MKDETKFGKVQELIYEMKVGDAMVRDVVTVSPAARVSGLREIFRARHISGVPVVENGKLVGIVSLEDFIKWLADGSGDCPIRDKMTMPVKTLYADDALVLAVSKFERLGFGRFPVLDRATGNLAGVLTKGDIIEGVLRKLEIDYHEEEIHKYRASHIFEDVIADKVAVVLESRVPARDFQKAGQASAGIRKTLARLNVHPVIVRRAAIASYEAEMNLVIFAENGQIRAEIRPKSIRIDVTDSGPGIPDIKKALEPGYSTAPEWVRELGFGAGMGLINIQKCADNFEITSAADKGTHLKIGIKVPPVAV